MRAPKSRAGPGPKISPMATRGQNLRQWRRDARCADPGHLDSRNTRVPSAVRCEIRLPAQWIDASAVEMAVQHGGHPHGPETYDVEFRFPVGSQLMIDAAIRMLSLANQLAATSRRVRFVFDEGEPGTMGYLNRVEFFDHLTHEVEVLPARPMLSTAAVHRGGNAGLVEIARINKDHRDHGLLGRLADAVKRGCASRADIQELTDAAWTIFAELIDNVFSHSQTPLDGYAALQVYPRGDRLMVAVSDSGVGIMDTLRPALQNTNPNLANLSDLDLLVEIFRQGISRHGSDRGDGLRGSAAKAIKFQADLDVRLPFQRVRLTPARGGYAPNTAYCFDRLPLLWGTHIAFTFRLHS